MLGLDSLFKEARVLKVAMQRVLHRGSTVRTANITDWTFIISVINQAINYRLWPSLNLLLVIPGFQCLCSI